MEGARGFVRIESKDLHQVCEVLPSLSVLGVEMDVIESSMAVMPSFALLSSLGIKDVWHRPTKYEFDLRLLPLSVRDLLLINVKIGHSPLEGLKSLGLTSLSLQNASVLPEEAFDVLQQLPALQVTLVCSSDLFVF